MPPLYFTKKARAKALPEELRLIVVEEVWNTIAKSHAGKCPTISGARQEAGAYRPSDLGWVTMREFYRALMTGKLNAIFGCDLRVGHSGKSETLIRRRGSWFWLEGIAKQIAKPEGIVVMDDGGTRRPHDSLQVLLKESFQKESQMLKIGFHRLCQSNEFVCKREQWKEEDAEDRPVVGATAEASVAETPVEQEKPAAVVGLPTVDVIVGIPVAEAAKATVEEPAPAQEPPIHTEPEEKAPKADVKMEDPEAAAEEPQPAMTQKDRRQHQIPGDPAEGSFHRKLVETWRAFKEKVRKRTNDNIFVDNASIGPTLEGYQIICKRRKTGAPVVDFYITARNGTLLRSEQDVWRHFA